MAVLVAVVIPGLCGSLSKDLASHDMGRGRCSRQTGWPVRATGGQVLEVSQAGVQMSVADGNYTR